MHVMGFLLKQCMSNQIKQQQKNKSALHSNNAQLFSDLAATQTINGCIVFK